MKVKNGSADLDLLLIVDALAEERSGTPVARRLRISQPTLSKKVRSEPR
jgi:DNA-binding transcriptional LysR family regulator